jgi:hypothetical protein
MSRRSNEKGHTMLSSLKPLALALFLALLGIATAAAAAPAAQFHSEVEPTYVEVAGGSTHVFTFGTEFGSREMKCNPATHLADTQATKTAESVTAGPIYQVPCSVAGFPGAINNNGCKFRLFAAGTVNLECPTAAGLVVSNSNCSVTLLPQSGKKGMTYVNSGNGITATFEVELAYTSGGFFCPGSGVGIYKGTSALIGRNSGGTQVKYWYE